jgi:hypothetical protein
VGVWLTSHSSIPKDDVKQLIEHALGRLGYIGLGESEETRANVLVLEPASALHLDAACPLREVWPGLPIVSVSVLAPFPERSRSARPPTSSNRSQSPASARLSRACGTPTCKAPRPKGVSRKDLVAQH